MIISAFNSLEDAVMYVIGYDLGLKTQCSEVQTPKWTNIISLHLFLYLHYRAIRTNKKFNLTLESIVLSRLFVDYISLILLVSTI